jgi:hypothetical protein
MTRTWCDSCEKEITNKNQHNEQIPCHLFSFEGMAGYIDSEGMPTSGRRDGIVLCSECWNRGWSAFLTQLNLPKEEHVGKKY